MFFRLSIKSPTSRDRLRGAARGLDLFRRFSAELMRTNGQRLADLTPRQHLHRPLRTVHQPVLAQQLRRDDSAGVELRSYRVEAHDDVFDAERIVEAALRYASVQRHLAAFEPAFELEPRSRFRALVTAPGRLPVSRSLAAANSFLRVRRAVGRPQIVESHH